MPNTTPPPLAPTFEGGVNSYHDQVVEIKIGVTLKVGGVETSYTDGITIRITCPRNPHLVQFVYREIIDADGNPKKLKMQTTGGAYDTTIDPKRPVWNTDSGAKPHPYYEGTGMHQHGTGTLTIFDQPIVQSPVGPLNIQHGETSRATFRSYVICDDKVVREVNWVRSVQHGEAPSYSVTVRAAHRLPKWAQDQLRKQGFHLIH